MLKLIKQGGKLENREMNKIYGSGTCGTPCGEACGISGNDLSFNKSYFQWLATSNG